MPRQRVVIVGGGFAGATTARHLLRRGGDAVSVELIDRRNYFVFQPLLPEVAGGAVNALDTATPLRQMLPGAAVRVAEVRSVDFAGRTIEVVEGPAARLVTIPYDQLVLAFGQAVDLARFPGLAEHAYTVKEAADSFDLRNHVICCLDRAGTAVDADARRRLLTFAVVGGGLSGVEVVGEIHELVRRALPYYRELGHNEPRFVLVEYLPRILPELPDSLAAYAAGTLRRRGIVLMLGHGVLSAAEGSLELDDGSLIDTATIVATIGNGPQPLATRLGIALDHGRIAVEADMRLPGHDAAWALGDAARIPLGGGGAAPPTAQAAVREASVLAGNILAVLAGRPTRPLAYRPRGVFASLGGRRAVAQIGRVRLSGRGAWLLWRLVYLGMLPVWPTRLRVAAEQLLDLVLPRSTVRTSATSRPPSRFVVHRAGDTAIAAGQVGDGVHLVVEGSYRRVAEDGMEMVYCPGDTFGAEEILAFRPHRRPVVARETSRCFLLRRDEVERMAAALNAVARPRLDADGRRLMH